MRGHGLTSLADLPAPRRVGDMAAIALALESEAQRRLEAFAAGVKAIARPEVLALLARLADAHARRGDRLRSRWGSDVDKGVVVELPKTLLPQVFVEDQVEVCDRYGLTSYKVIALEVAATQRRFTLYSYLAAAARDSAARDCAEEFASSELGRAADLRVARRRAYRAEGRELSGEGIPSPALIESLADLVAAALMIEQALERHLTAAGQSHPVLSPSIDATRHQVEELRSLKGGLGRPKAVPAKEPKRPSRLTSEGGSEDENGTMPLPQLLAECERAFAFYDAAAGKAASSSVMLRAQALSQVALERIKRVVAAQ